MTSPRVVRIAGGTRLKIRYRDAGELMESTTFHAHEEHVLLPTKTYDEMVRLLRDTAVCRKTGCNCWHCRVRALLATLEEK